MSSSKWNFRDVSAGLQALRNFLLGRKHNLHGRFAAFISPRTIPPPDIPRGPEYKYSKQYYYERNAMDSVMPPVVAPVAQGPPLNRDMTKKTPPGGGIRPESVCFKCAPTPGLPWWWDGHCYFECIPDPPVPPSKPCPEPCPPPKPVCAESKPPVKCASPKNKEKKLDPCAPAEKKKVCPPPCPPVEKKKDCAPPPPPCPPTEKKKDCAPPPCPPVEKKKVCPPPPPACPPAAKKKDCPPPPCPPVEKKKVCPPAQSPCSPCDKKKK